MTNEQRYDLKKLTLILSSRCNLDCAMCMVVKGPKRSLSARDALRIAEFGLRHHFAEIELSGGEPFLVRYLDELLQLLDTGASEIKIVTNGTLLSSARVARLQKLKRLIVQVSVDGTERSHDAIRGLNGAYRKTLRNINKLLDAGVRVSINTVVQRANVDHLVDLYRAFEQLPIEFHGFALYEEATYPDPAAITISGQEIPRLVASLRQIRELGRPSGTKLALTLGLIEGYRRRLTAPGYRHHPGFGCSVPYKSVFVTERGEVIPCLHAAWDSTRVMRNVRERPIDEIVFGDDYVAAIDEAIGSYGCPGCNTLCYNWDPSFRRKIMQPGPSVELMRRLSGLAPPPAGSLQDGLRRRLPATYALLRGLRATLGGRATTR